MFKRFERVHYTLDDGTEHETTIAQLNFVHWMLRYGVLDWLIAHRDAVERDMVEAHRANRVSKKAAAPAKRRRMHLVEPTKRIVTVTRVERTSTFE